MLRKRFWAVACATAMVASMTAGLSGNVFAADDTKDFAGEELSILVILARLDAAEDEKIRGELDRELHKKIAKIADNPMVYSVLAAADQLIESIVSGTRDYIMKKNNSAREVDDQHHRLVEAIINGDAEQAERCMSEHMDTIERYMEEMQKKS